MTKFYPSKIAKNDMRRVDVPQWKIKLLNDILSNHNYLVESHYCDNCDTIIYSDKAEKVPTFLFCSKFCEESYKKKEAIDTEIIEKDKMINERIGKLKDIVKIIEGDKEKFESRVHRAFVNFTKCKKLLEKRYDKLKVKEINREYPSFPRITVFTKSEWENHE